MTVLSDKIKNQLIDSMKEKAKSSTEEEKKQLLSELTKQSQTRYKESIDAINRSEMYLTWMTESGSSFISEIEKDKFQSFFEIKMELASNKAIEVSNAEKVIEDLVSTSELDLQKHQFLVKQYVQAKNGQLSVLKQIMEKENELGVMFEQYSKDFLTRNFNQIQKQMPQSAQSLSNAMNVIKKDTLDIQDIFKLNYQAVLQSIDQLHKHLDKRKEKLSIINKIITHLDNTLEKESEQNNELIDGKTVQSIRDA